jgi:hypothetical protein
MNQTAVCESRVFQNTDTNVDIVACFQYRAKSDINNSMYAGCLTGGILARSGIDPPPLSCLRSIHARVEQEGVCVHIILTCPAPRLHNLPTFQ